MKLCVKLTAKFRPPPNLFRGYKPINTDTSLQLPGTSSAGRLPLFTSWKFTQMNGGFMSRSGYWIRTNFNVAYSGKRPRVCENPKPKISSGNQSLYFLVSELNVGYLYPDKQIDGSFVKCYPKINDRQIVFTHPRPEADPRATSAQERVR